MTWRVPGAAIALTVIFWLIPGGLQAQDGSDDWQWRASIYGWLPDIEAKTQFPTGGSGPTIEVDASTLIDNLDFTAMGALQVRKGKWGAFTDVMYVDEGVSKSGVRDITLGQAQLPAGVDYELVYDMESWVWNLAGTYSLAATESNVTDLVFGARMVDIAQDLRWTAQGQIGPIAPPARSGSGEVSFTNWDAIVGIKGYAFLGSSRHWVIPYYLDLGAGDSDLTIQAMAGLGYSFSWGELVATWRYLDYDLPSDGVVSDLNFSGPMVGASFAW
jgi:hypothetical protein